MPCQGTVGTPGLVILGSLKNAFLRGTRDKRQEILIFQKSSCTFTFWGYTLSEPYWRFPNLYPKPLVLPLIISDNLDDFWALNARATSKKLTVFSMKTGQLLPGAGGEKELKTPTCQQLETKVFPFFFPFFSPRNQSFSHFANIFSGDLEMF